VLSIETGRGIIHAFRDVITEREFPDLRWHDLRHEGISRLFELTDLRDHEIMAITVNSDLAQALREYADLYSATYGAAEDIAELIPYMLAAFIDGDAAFKKARRGRQDSLAGAGAKPRPSNSSPIIQPNSPGAGTGENRDPK